MSTSVANRIGWLWDVEFARWVSPDTTSLQVHVVAEHVGQAVSEAVAAARRIWGEEASNLAVRCATRRSPVNGIFPGGGAPGGET